VAVRPPTRLSEFAASWMELRGPQLKSGTKRRYGFALAKVLPVLGDIYVAALAPSDISKYIADRTASGAMGHTVLNELRVLRTMSKDSVADGYADRDWCDRVRAPKVRRYTKDRPNLFTAPQFELVLARLATESKGRWLGLVLFMTTTGLRWGEASALHWQDIDWATGEATIRYSNDRGTLGTVKNDGSYRTVPVVAEVAATWGARLETGLVFPNRDGRLHKGWPLIRVLARVCKATGMKHVVTAHGLRRTFNNLARTMTTREVLKSITGHVTDTMVQHYSMIGAGEKMTVGSAVARSFGVVTGGKGEK
jgi:integrase